jgi:hypothetical protein
VTAEASSQYTDDSWSAQQATGAPDTPEAGDNSTAWAAASADVEVETLVLVYSRSLLSRSESKFTRATIPAPIVKIEVLDPNTDTWVVVWEGVADTAGEEMAVFSPELTPVDFSHQPSAADHRRTADPRLERDRRGQARRHSRVGIQASGVIHHASGVIHHASGVIHHASGVIHHASGVIHHASGVIHHASGVIHHASGVIHHASGVIHHASGVIHHAPGVTSSFEPFRVTPDV